MGAPLEGVRVLELAIWHNGPAAGYMLGDLGAEVIKIEPPITGDPNRGRAIFMGATTYLPDGRNVWFEVANRSKKDIILDLKKEKGREVLYRLVEKSDVFFTNFSKRVLQELGCTYDTLRQYNPRLIYALNAGYGTKGADAGLRTFDQMVQARIGFMYCLGDRDDPEPHMALGAIFDQTGATMLAFGIITALLVRERTGIGQELETSLLSGAVHLHQAYVNNTLWMGRPWARFSRARSRDPMTNIYQCADGKWLIFDGSEGEKFWPEFCQALGFEEGITNPRYNDPRARRETYAELIATLVRILATKTRDQWLSLFRGGGYRFAYGPVNDPTEVATDPQLLENEYIVDWEHPSLGKVKTTAVPIKFSRTPGRIASPAPQFGQHTEEVLLEVGGYSWEEIGQLKEDGVI